MCDPLPYPRHSGNLPDYTHKEALQLEFIYSSLPVDGQGTGGLTCLGLPSPHQVMGRWLVVGPVGQPLGSQAIQAAGWLTDRQLLQAGL